MADSISERVGDLTETAITALALGPTISRRKVPNLPDGKEPPELVISIGSEGRTEYTTRVQKRKTYPVAVTIITGTGTKAADDNTIRKWREDIEEKLESVLTWASLVGFDDVEITNEAPFDSSVLSKDFNYSTVTVAVSVLEARA